MLLLKIKKFGEKIGVRKKSDAANLIPGRNDAIEKWRFLPIPLIGSKFMMLGQIGCIAGISRTLNMMKKSASC